MKINASGSFQWARRWNYNKNAGGSFVASNEEGPSIDIDAQGNIIAVGHFVGDVNFDPDTGSFIMSATQGDGYILKLNANGGFVWAKQIKADTAVGKFVIVRSVSVDGANNVFVSGYFKGKADFNPDTTAKFEIDAVSQQGFILKLDANGNFLWAKKIGKDGAHPLLNYNTSHAVKAEASGNVYITGSFMETVNFGNTTLTSNGLSDIYIAKLDAGGNYLWAKSAGSFYDNEYGYKMTLDAADNLLLSGNFHGSISFEGNTLTTNGGEDMFVVKMTPSGSVLWAKGFGGSGGFERIQSIAADGNDVYTCGRMVGTMNFDPNGYYYQSSGSAHTFYPNFFIHKMNASPTHVKNVLLENDINIYPNPTNGIVNIHIENAVTGNKTVGVFDLSGKLIVTKQSTGNKFIFDMSAFSKGIYLVNIRTEKGNIYKKLSVN